MEAAETRWHDVLADIFRSVPPSLWRLASRPGSLLPLKEPSRSPGCAFVEVDGADGALSQAMLTLVFRIVRCGDVPGSLLAPGVVCPGGFCENSEGNTDAGGEMRPEERPQATRPWSTAEEALAATAFASADGDDGDGDGVGFAGRLVRLFSDQDDALVDMLIQNLYIFHNTRPMVSAKRGYIAARATLFFLRIYFQCSIPYSPATNRSACIVSSDVLFGNGLRLLSGYGKQRMILFGQERDPCKRTVLNSLPGIEEAVSQRATSSLLDFFLLRSHHRLYSNFLEVHIGNRFLGVDDDFSPPPLSYQGGEQETIHERSTSSSPGLRNLYDSILHPGTLFAALLSEVWLVSFPHIAE